MTDRYVGPDACFLFVLTGHGKYLSVPIGLLLACNRILFCCKLFIIDNEAYDLCDCRNCPRENIQQIQGRNGMEIGKYGIDPCHTEHA